MVRSCRARNSSGKISSKKFERLRKGSKRPVFDSRKHFQEKNCWVNFFLSGAGFRPFGTTLSLWVTVLSHWEPFWSVSEELPSFAEGCQPVAKVFHQLGKALASCQGFWPTCGSFCQWNSIGSNGIPLDPMEFHGIERTGAMTIDDGRRSWSVIV